MRRSGSTKKDRPYPKLQRRHVFVCETVLTAAENTRNCGAITDTKIFMHVISSPECEVRKTYADTSISVSKTDVLREAGVSRPQLNEPRSAVARS
ncbi:hypothetical protein PUN28_005970 [Cardiocondyla obscurior]|uniref:Uncharacterized protein n=1 Tax=Cardiocondyla obscurior TaxID=286306 RepID=A0AAW2GA60_9HYME